MEKKGFVFTFISILFVSVILIAFLIQVTNVTRVKTEESRVKVETVNSFLRSIEKNQINSALKTSTTRSLEAMTNCIIEQGKGKNSLYKDPVNVLTNLIEFGDLSRAGNDRKQQCDNIISETMTVNNKLATISNSLEELISAADQIGLDLDFYPDGPEKIPPTSGDYQLTITQTDPWNIDVAIILDFDLKTKDNTIKWEIRDFQNTGKTSIIGLRDPAYAAFEGKSFVIYRWNGIDIDDMITNVKFYDPVAQGKATFGDDVNDPKDITPPSYIERFDEDDYNKGRAQYSCCGIEAIIKPSDAKAPLDRTWVDYLQYDAPKVVGVSCTTDDPINPRTIKLDNVGAGKKHRNVYHNPPDLTCN